MNKASLLAALVMIGASWMAKADEPAEIWAEDLNTALTRAQKSNKPVLLVIRNPHSVASIDVGHWLKEDADFSERVSHFEPALVWDGHPSLQTLQLHGRPVLVFLTPKGELITSEEAPHLKFQMKERLDLVIQNPFSLDKLYELCATELKKGPTAQDFDTRNFKRAIEVLTATGNADRALPLQQVLNGRGENKPENPATPADQAKSAVPPAHSDDTGKSQKEKEEAKDREKKEKKEREKREKEAKKAEEEKRKEAEKKDKNKEKEKESAKDKESGVRPTWFVDAKDEDKSIEWLEAQARQHVAGHLMRAIRAFEALNSEKAEDRPQFIVLKAAVARGAQIMNREDASSVKAIADADAAVDAYGKTPAEESLRAARKALTVLIPGYKAAADALNKQAAELSEKFAKAHPDHFSAKISEFSRSFQEYRKSRNEEKIKAAFNDALATSMPTDVFADIAGFFVNAIIEFELDTERTALAERIEREMPLGRNTADVFLDLADAAYERNQKDEAIRLYKLAEKAADNGESPVLLKTARAMLALVDGKGTPNATRWAKREVRDVVVLVQDYASYLDAISHWTDKDFFPVLFADDMYAPKFVAAFKPSHVVFWPGSPEKEKTGPYGTLPPIDQIRKVLLQSWSSDTDKNKIETVSDDDLRAKLKKIDAKSMGVVFGDGESGEMAGGIALAAGRFQGLEILPRPTVGNEGHIGDPEHYMDLPRINAMAARVAEGLKKWGLPVEDRWATVTLAGRYPYRYSGKPSAWGHGTDYTVDDMLGRGEDMIRIGVTSRLVGDAARSAYQAMCSMFLQPETALLFNTYGYDPKNKNIWGAYRMQFAEDAFKARLKVTHVQSDRATTETFRENVLPWNRNDLIMINSSGGPYSWSITGSSGTGEDLPVGAPCAIHVTHSGSAAECYDPESMAGRAVWGGAFWYFGSAAEPFLTAFQPPRYYAPRIMAGASFSTIFRQRAAQNFYLPWRLLIIGDPQFCLRDKPVKRVPADEVLAKLPKAAKVENPEQADAEVRKMGEKFDVTCKPDEFTAQIRHARLLGNSFVNGESFLASTDLKALDARGLAMAIDELLKGDQTTKAVALWRDASADARKDADAKRIARIAAGRQMDKALTAKNLKELTGAFADLLSTDPPRNYVERWTAKASALATEQKADAELATWMLSIASDPRAAAHKPFFLLEALKKKTQWTVEDKAVGLAGFQSFVKELREDWTLGGPFKEFCDLYLAKVKDATGDTLLADLRATFKDDTPEGKMVAPHLKSLEQRLALHQDWLILGPFKDAAAGAWEKVGPKAGATAPDYNAVFTDGKELKWSRPYKPESKGVVDLLKLLNPNANVYAYGAVEVQVEKDTEGVLLIGSDDGVTAWLDGKEIHKNIVARGLNIDQDRVPVKLSAGTHSLVLCITQGGGGWEFCARFADAQGNPLQGVKMKCPGK